MLNTQKYANIICTAVATLIAAVLILCTFPVEVCALAYHTDNPAGNTMPFFPSPGSDENLMNNNRGNIETFYSGGQIFNNYGTIVSSAGRVNVNYGTIKSQLSGTVGTNTGIIESLSNTAALTVNDTVGVVKTNLATIGRNYGTVETNIGCVSMYGGKLEENTASGEVIFQGNAATGTVALNSGKVTVSDCPKYIYVTTNTGNITVSNATVVVQDNTGVITLCDKSTVICENNSGTITKDENAVTYVSDCKRNFGTITFWTNSTGSWPSTHDYYKLVFSGDDGKAVITYGTTDYKGATYTYNRAYLTFTLPDDYICTNPDATRDKSNPNTWHVSPWLDEEYTEFTVFCEKSLPPEYCISGTVTSFGDESQTTAVTIKKQGESEPIFSANCGGENPYYRFENAKAGSYILTFSKENHATREYTVTVVDADVTQDAEILLLGDVNADGKINRKDYTVFCRFAALQETPAGYDLAVMDQNGDSKFSLKDITLIKNYLLGTDVPLR